MSDFINTLVNTLNGYLWGPIMIVLCLGVAIIYSVVLKFRRSVYSKAWFTT